MLDFDLLMVLGLLTFISIIFSIPQNSNINCHDIFQHIILLLIEFVFKSNHLFGIYSKLHFK